MTDYLLQMINIYWREMNVRWDKTHISTLSDICWFFRGSYFQFSFSYQSLFRLRTSHSLFVVVFVSVLSPCILSTSSTFAFAFSFSRLFQDCVKIHWSIFWKYLVLCFLVALSPLVCLWETFNARSLKLPFSLLRSILCPSVPWSR